MSRDNGGGEAVLGAASVTAPPGHGTLLNSLSASLAARYVPNPSKTLQAGMDSYRRFQKLNDDILQKLYHSLFESQTDVETSLIQCLMGLWEKPPDDWPLKLAGVGSVRAGPVLLRVGVDTGDTGQGRHLKFLGEGFLPGLSGVKGHAAHTDRGSMSLAVAQLHRQTQLSTHTH